MACLVAGGSDRCFFSEPGGVDVSKNLRHRAKAKELATLGAMDDAIRIRCSAPPAAVAARDDGCSIEFEAEHHCRSCGYVEQYGDSGSGRKDPGGSGSRSSAERLTRWH